MLVGWIVAAVVVVGLVVGVLARQRSYDDVHSVEHYHRKLHTLEAMRAHPAGSGLSSVAAAANGGGANGDAHSNGANGSGTTEVLDAPDTASQEKKESAGAAAGAVAAPTSAMRVSGSSTVRLTDADQPPPPPPPPPPLTDLSTPVRFDDAGTEAIPGTFMHGGNDRAMESINHRPRRLGGPLAAMGVVVVLVVILIVTGLHTTTPTSSHSHSQSHAPAHKGSPAAHPAVTPTTVHAQTHAHPRTTPSTTSTTLAVVSAPSSTSSSSATYTVGSSTYALVLSATSGQCWLQVTDGASGSVLYSSTLASGQSHTVNATGPVTVEVGAPSAFAATVNGAPVTLPASYQAPLMLKFVPPSSAGSGTGSASG